MRARSILSLSLLLFVSSSGHAQEGSAEDQAFTVRKKLAGEGAGEIKCDGLVKKGGAEVVLKRCAKRNFDAYEEEAKKSGIIKDIREYDAQKHAKLAKTLAFYEKAHKKAETDYEGLAEHAQPSDDPGWAAEEKKNLEMLKKIHGTYSKALKECNKSKYHKVFKCPAAPKKPPKAPKPRSKCEPGMKCGGSGKPSAPAGKAE